MFQWLLRLLNRNVRRDDYFVLAVRRAFAFLVSEYGFLETNARLESRVACVEYEKVGVKVIVDRELGSAVQVTLQSPMAIEPGLRREFGLHELEQEMKRAGQHTLRPIAQNLEEEVRASATVLRELGTEVLNGDFGVLLERQRRHLAAVRRAPR